MEFIFSFFYGLVQGLTEFLPISSSGHLLLFDLVFGTSESSLLLVLTVHVATVLAIFFVFFKDLKKLSLVKSKNSQKLLLHIFIALVPLLFTGVFLKGFVEELFDFRVVPFGFLLTAFFLLSLFLPLKKEKVSLTQMPLYFSFLIGLFQCLAVLPGFSRSGWTIGLALHLGLKPREAAYFSFLISIPAILGSAMLELLSHPSDFEFSFSLLISFFSSLVFGVLALLLVLRLVKQTQFYLFAFYLIPLSLGLFFMIDF